MGSYRNQRRIDSLLDQSEEAMDLLRGDAMREYAQAALAQGPGNTDSLADLDSAPLVRQFLAGGATATSTIGATFTRTDQLASFANGRCEVKRFLGEGG